VAVCALGGNKIGRGINQGFRLPGARIGAVQKPLHKFQSRLHLLKGDNHLRADIDRAMML
jgi:hypothetical protein